MKESEIIRLDWHAAYFEAIQAELIDYLPYLHFLPEHPLNEKPLRIDAMIIKAKPGVEIKKNFAEEFRGHNIIEFKHPNESLTMPKYIKTIGYACLYQSIARVAYQDITLTMICTKHPRKLLKDLRENPLFSVTEKHPGIYVIEGERFPVRIIESKRLTEEENIWLKSLRKDANWRELEKIIELSEATRRRVNLGAYLHALLSANRTYVMEGMNMSKRESQEIRQMWEQIMDETGYRARVMAEGEARGEARGVTLGIDNTLTIIKGLRKNTPLSQLAKESGIPLREVEKIQRELIPAT